MEVPPTRLDRALTWLGGGAFALSLAFGAWVYVVRWGRTPGTAAIDWSAAAFDCALFTAFAAHHSLFARTGAKAVLARVVREPLLRSLYVWIASGLFFVVMASWQPVGGLLYEVTGLPSAVLAVVQASGLVLTIASVRVIDALELAGIRSSARTGLQMRGPYLFVRHPLYLAWVLMVFGASRMTGDRALFAIVSSLYLVVAIPWEERSLRAAFGDAYARYTERVRWRILPGVY